MSEYENRKKIVFLGDSEVGKSAIIIRFTRAIFDTNIYEQLTGKWVSKTIEIPELGESLLVDFWDTYGYEKYRSLNKFFTRMQKLLF